MLRVVLDTNVLVSGELYPLSIPGKIVTTGRQGGLLMVLSEFILSELTRVLARLTHTPKDPIKIQALVNSFRFQAEMVTPQDDAMDPRLRDPADQPVLQTLLMANADYLITGDKDLLTLAAHYPVITPAHFWEKHVLWKDALH